MHAIMGKLSMEKKIGLCIHKMIGGELDSGDIISKRNYIKINSNTRIGLVYEEMEKIIQLFLNQLINSQQIKIIFKKQVKK